MSLKAGQQSVATALTYLLNRATCTQCSTTFACPSRSSGTDPAELEVWPPGLAGRQVLQLAGGECPFVFADHDRVKLRRGSSSAASSAAACGRCRQLRWREQPTSKYSATIVP
ncbi:hypothetical protein [Micromonospora echinospora]|uniref:hypothetical protein n=1 Tax=Micromonospora echinospora TaxID=1877 RepID=UPI003A86E18B